MLRNDMWNCWQSGRPNVHPSTLLPKSLSSRFSRNTDSIVTDHKEDYRKKKIWMELVLSFQLHPSISMAPFYIRKWSFWLDNTPPLSYLFYSLLQLGKRQRTLTEEILTIEAAVCVQRLMSKLILLLPKNNSGGAVWLLNNQRLHLKTKWKRTNCYTYIE